MRRLVAALLAAFTVIGAAAAAAAAGSSADPTAPSKTTALPGQTAAAPTTLPAATTLAPPPTTSVTGQFDPATFLTDFYTTIGTFPADAVDLIEQLDPGSPAELFFLHELFAAIAVFANTNAPLPTYTVTPAGTGFTVCRDGAVCETFADFVVNAGGLESFRLDGQPIDDRVAGFVRPTTVETLTVDGAIALRRPRDEALSVVVLLTSTGGGTSFAWEQASYADETGRTYPLDLSASQFPVRIEDGDGAIAHVTYPGARAGGQLTFPITSDQTGVPTTVRVPIVAN
jgi:hypothetical protein